MSQKPISCRRATSSFVSDPSNINRMQVSPRINVFHSEQRNPFIVTKQASKTNFIGDSGASLPAGRRAFAVTETGEKLLIQLDDDDDVVRSTHHFSGAALPKILEQSSSHLLLSGAEKSNKNQRDNSASSCKLRKKYKNARHNVCQKNRVICTPRNIEKSSSTRLLSEINLPKSKLLSIQSRKNTSSETQTDYSLNLPSSSCIPRKYNSTSESTVPLPITSMYHSSDSILNDLIEESPHKLAHRHPTSLDRTSPLKIYTKSNGNFKNYSEFCRIVSSLTLITVIWWLLSTFFDLESLYDNLNNFLEHIQNWYSTKEKPKTKAELFVKFIQDLWT